MLMARGQAGALVVTGGAAAASAAQTNTLRVSAQQINRDDAA
jgi:hypothetical protein